MKKNKKEKIIIRNMVKEEIESLNEDVDFSINDIEFIRKVIRKEVAMVFYDLWRKKAAWTKK